MMRLCLLAALAGGIAIAQTPARAFEIASVKANLSDGPLTDFVPHRSGARITMHNAELRSVIAWAYRLSNPDYELVAGIGEKSLRDSYDIDALAPGLPDDDLRTMFQTLLADRFKLKVHREAKELQAYDLVVARSGAKLIPAQPGPKYSVGFGGSSSWVEITAAGPRLIGKGASLRELAVVLTRQMGVPVRDRTGITGTFNYDVAFTRGVDASDAPFLTTAIHELGLNLERSRGAFDALVVDHVEKPSEN